MKSYRHLLILAMTSASVAYGQGANLDVTIYPQTPVGQSPSTRAGFLVCVGTSTDLTKYGTEITTTSGVANQNFRNLPTGTAVRVTITKAGYTGVQLGTTLRTGWDNHLQATINPGTGGPACTTPSSTPPSTPTSTPTSGATSYPTRLPQRTIAPPPTPAPAPRLGEQTLTHWGRQLSSSKYTTLDCKSFGNNYVIIGIRGKHGEGVDQISLLCRKLTPEGSVFAGFYPDDRYTATIGGNAGTNFTTACQSGTAVVGIEGTMLMEQVRGLIFRCQALTKGLANKDFVVPVSTAYIGNKTAPDWGPNYCGSGRPARALRVGKDVFLTGIPFADFVAPTIIAAVQLICEQPPYN